jgi:pyruvate/2-oxoglutarate dehydrogenase complex dihydrolipoamide acyltransferase (E2) component
MTMPLVPIPNGVPQDVTRIERQEFGGVETRDVVETSSVAVAAQARAAIEASFVMAMRYPRSWDQVRAKLLGACERPLFADAAIFAKPVGKQQNENTGEWEDKIIEGLSIRFAEEAARNMRNLDIDSFGLYDDSRKKIVKFVVTDLESNVKWSKTVTVMKTTERRKLKKNQQPLGSRLNSYGELVYIVEATADDVAKQEGAEASKAWRDGILKNIPADIKEEAMAKCYATLENRMAVDPDGERKKLLDSYLAIGVDPLSLRDYVGHDLKTLSPAELIKLRKLFVAIRDGEVTWGDVLEGKIEHIEKKAADEAAAEIKAKREAEKAKPQGSAISEATQRARAEREAAKPAAAATPQPAAKPSAPPAKGPADGLDTISPVELDNLRSEVARLAAEAEMSNEEVSMWWEKDELSQLNHEELRSSAAKLRARLAQMKAAAVPAAVAPEQAPKFVASTAKQRRDIAVAATGAHIQIADVCKWFGAASTAELSREQADEALAKIRTVTGEEVEDPEPGTNDE